MALGEAKSGRDVDATLRPDSRLAFRRPGRQTHGAHTTQGIIFADVRGRFRGSGSRDGLTIITSPSVESDMAGSAVGRRRDAVREPASSRVQVPEPILYNRQQVSESADESLDSNDGEYEGNDGQSEETEESEEN